MARIDTPRFTCDADGCQAEKRDTNHWWMVDPIRKEVSLDNRPITGCEINQFEEDEVSGRLYACGMDCLPKVVSKLIGPGKQP